MTNPTICRGTPSRSMACIAFGNADSLEVVANAITAGSRPARAKCRKGALSVGRSGEGRGGEEGRYLGGAGHLKKKKKKHTARTPPRPHLQLSPHVRSPTNPLSTSLSPPSLDVLPTLSCHLPNRNTLLCNLTPSS